VDSNFGFHLRIIHHILFWLIYYITFGFIWAEGGDYWQSYYLEFILLPIRILAVYFTIFLLIPQYLQHRKIIHFATGYLGLILICAVLQRLFIFFFYEGIAVDQNQLWDLTGILRAIILINSTVLFVSAIKITQLWWLEGDKNNHLQTIIKSIHSTDRKDEIIEIKAEKRINRIPADELLFVEGLGNYVIYHTQDKKLISYTSLKQALEELPEHFIRIHKSYLVNMNHVTSYDHEDIEVGGNLLPLGRAFRNGLSLHSKEQKTI